MNSTTTQLETATRTALQIRHTADTGAQTITLPITDAVALTDIIETLSQRLSRTGKAGRKPLGKRAATGTERAKKSRAKKKA